jgi:hypothetical protein
MNIRTRGAQAGGTIVFQIRESREKGYFLAFCKVWTLRCGVPAGAPAGGIGSFLKK